MMGRPRTELTKQTRIGVLYGGLASERETSLVTGKNCFEALKRRGYANAVLIDVDRDIAGRLRDEKIEVVYNALHGRYGEDGCIQGLCEMMGIPYTGNGVRASALTMDKELTKSVLKSAGLPVLPSATVTVNGKPADLAKIAHLRYPVMVKPMGEGSSIGMSKVNSPDDLEPALSEAARYDERVMVEEFVKGKSITVGVFDREGEPVVTPILELRSKKTDWYDLESKYTKELTEFIIPAELPEEVTRKIQGATLAAHQACGCHGVSRIDFIVDGDDPQKFYILEINTVPGMTEVSDLPAQANAMGISYDELVEYLLKTAVN